MSFPKYLKILHRFCCLDCTVLIRFILQACGFGDSRSLAIATALGCVGRIAGMSLSMKAEAC